MAPTPRRELLDIKQREELARFPAGYQMRLQPGGASDRDLPLELGPASIARRHANAAGRAPASCIAGELLEPP